MRAFVFPGQGSQSVGMALEAYRERGTVRDIFDRANGVLGYRLMDIMFQGPEEELKRTENAQPALFLHSYALYQMLDAPDPAMVAGHSLGEYTALAVAGALTFDDALRLVKTRAAAMAAAGEEEPGTMGAIIGLSDEVVTEICVRLTDKDLLVVPANYNADGQIVVSGTRAGVAAALEEAKSVGARMATELNVSGAFHSPLMKRAEETLAEALREAPIHPAEIPVYMNASATPVTEPEEIRSLLLTQLTAPVLWTQSIRAMIADGATEFVEVGQGKVLQKLVGRISKEAGASGLETLSQIDEFNSTFKSQH